MVRLPGGEERLLRACAGRLDSTVSHTAPLVSNYIISMCVRVCEIPVESQSFHDVPERNKSTTKY